MLDVNNLSMIDDPFLTTRWWLLMPDQDGPFQCVAETVGLTFPSIPSQPRYGGASNTYFPDTNDIEGLAITFYETHDLKVSRYLTKWRNKVVDGNGYYGVPSDYKKTITAQLYKLESNTPTMVLNYLGTWPTDRGAYELQYEDETGRLQVQANFSVDSLEEK